jgi:hypothetical protein
MYHLKKTRAKREQFTSYYYITKRIGLCIWTHVFCKVLSCQSSFEFMVGWIDCSVTDAVAVIYEDKIL